MTKIHTSQTPRTVSIGGATYDLFLSMGRAFTGDQVILDAGKKTKIDRVTETCGGGACNTAVGLARLGCHAEFCGVVGSDQWGERLLSTMKNERVNVDGVTIVEGETSSFSLIFNLPSGERTILFTPGANEHLHDVTFDVDRLEHADCVYLNHLHESSCVIEDDITNQLAMWSNTHLTWNPGGCQIDRGMNDERTKLLLARTSLLLLNKEEACAFTHTSSIHDALSSLLAAGAARVCITDGKNGTVGADRKRRYLCNTVEGARIVDTTGAGDAFGSAATWAIITGLELPEALIAGTLNATSVLGEIGAQRGLLTEKDLQKKMSAHTLRVETIN